MRDVADAVGVSPATVSYVLNGKRSDPVGESSNDDYPNPPTPPGNWADGNSNGVLKPGQYTPALAALVAPASTIWFYDSNASIFQDALNKWSDLDADAVSWPAGANSVEIDGIETIAQLFLDGGGRADKVHSFTRLPNYSMLTPPLIAALRSSAGEELLREAAALPPDTLTRLTLLRKRHPPALAAAAVELLALRARATAKFSRADRMFFTPEGFEQSSGETIAAWRAGRFPDGAAVLDLCCGIGGDTAQLGGRGRVLAFDMSPAAAACAAANAEVYGVGDSVHVACADATRLRLWGLKDGGRGTEDGRILEPDGPGRRPAPTAGSRHVLAAAHRLPPAAFLDPSRRVGGRRVNDPREYQPPLSFVESVRQAVPDLAVKLSPALEDPVLESLGGRLEFVSDRGECKEALVWFGAIGPGGARSATLLPAGVSLCADPAAPPPSLSEPRGWLFEPDAAVVRAHLIAEVAERVAGAQIDPQIAYLTTDTPPASLFGTGYRILEWLPFNLRRLQERVRALGGRVAAVKRRGVPMEPEEITRRLTGSGELPLVIILTRVVDRPVALICTYADL